MTLEEMQDASARGDIHLKLGVVIDDVLAGGGAEDASIPKGSVLVSIDGKPVEKTQDVITFQEGKRRVTYAYLPAGSTGAQVTAAVRVDQGKTGIFLRSIPLELSAPKRNLAEAAVLSVRETAVVTSQTVLGIGRLFGSLAQKGQVPAGVTGIIGIAQLTYTSVQEGFIVYLRLVALLSLSLAVLNILPFPALDGGRLLFVLSELVVKPGNRRIEAVTNAIGFAVLLILILIVTFYDVFRLFR
jgi:regulator of sigma E protease